MNDPMKTTPETVITQYGFRFGAANVTRVCSDRTGQYLQIETGKHRLDVRITPGGRISTGLHRSDPKSNTFSVTTPKRPTP